MERSLLKEMTQKGLDAYLQRSMFEQLLYPRFFTLKQTPKLTWESIKGTQGSKIMADVIAYNASAPQKTREIVTKASGDIPKIAVKRSMDERAYNDYTLLKQTTNPSQQAILDLVFSDIDFVYNSVNARCEYLALQALSKGVLNLTLSNNNGLVTGTEVDFGIPTANKDHVAVVWSTPTTSTCITDIKAMMALAAENGHTLQYIIMRLEEFNYFVQSAEVKDLFGYYTGMKGVAKIAPNLTQINDYLVANMMPEIIVINQRVRYENAEHVRTVISPWNAGYVTYITAQQVGEMQHGPIAEEAATMPQVVRSKKGHILVSKWSELEPFTEWTKAQANAFPVLLDPQAIYIHNTASASSF